jgi:hypothetical protein
MKSPNPHDQIANTQHERSHYWIVQLNTQSAHECLSSSKKDYMELACIGSEEALPYITITDHKVIFAEDCKLDCKMQMNPRSRCGKIWQKTWLIASPGLRLISYR